MVFLRMEGQIVFDATGLSPEGGPEFLIPADAGSQVGGNLFHRFSDFSLANGESAVFQGPQEISNVFSRVTGGRVSEIHGSIVSEIAGADFYFLNPAGVIFGPTARIDVGGAFSVSSADYVRFSDASRFGDVRISDELSSAPPSAFGFADNPGEIEITGSELRVNVGEAIHVAGGDVLVRDADLVAPFGEVQLLSGNGAGEVSFAGDVVDISSMQGGSVRYDGADLKLEQSVLTIRAARTDLSLSGDLELNSGGLLRVERIRNSASSPFESEGLTLKAQSIRITGDGGSLPAGLWSGVDTSVEVVDAVSLVKGGEIRVTSEPDQPPADLSVEASRIAIDAENAFTFTGIRTRGPLVEDQVFVGGVGDVFINTPGELLLQNGGQVFTGSFTVVDSGSIRVRAGSLVADGGPLGLGRPTGLFASAYAGGNGGLIDLAIDTTRLVNGAVIEASARVPAFNAGDAGSVRIVSESQDAIGVSVLDDSLIRTDATFGDGGRIDVVSPRLLGSERIRTDSRFGAAGGMSIVSRAIDLSGSIVALETPLLDFEVASEGADLALAEYTGYATAGWQAQQVIGYGVEFHARSVSERRAPNEGLVDDSTPRAESVQQGDGAQQQNFRIGWGANRPELSGEE